MIQRLSKNRQSDACEPFSIVIPAFNEEAGIEHTLDHLTSCLADANVDFEIIVVNDGSTDATSDILRRRGDIELIEHEQNQGYGSSLKSGLLQAAHPLVVILDGDGTYPCEEILPLVQAMGSADMAVGARVNKMPHYPLLRRIPKWWLRRFAEWIVRRSIPDLNSGLRVFRREVGLQFFDILPDGFSFTTTITIALLTNGYHVCYRPIDYYPRLGSSKIRPIRDTINFLQLVIRTGMYFAPLRVFLPIAVFFAVLFFLSLARDLWHGDLTEATLLLLVTSTQVGIFSLLADMIDHRIGRTSLHRRSGRKAYDPQYADARD